MVHRRGVGDMQCEPFSSVVVHTDALGAHTRRHHVYINLVDIPRFGRSPGRQIAQRYAGTRRGVGENPSAEVKAVGKLRTRIVSHADKRTTVSGIGDIAHLQHASKITILRRTSHKTNLKVADLLVKFGQHHNVARITVIAVNAHRVALLAVTVGGALRTRKNLQTVQRTPLQETPAGKRAISHRIPEPVAHIDKLVEIFVIGNGDGATGRAEGRLGDTSGRVGTERAHAHLIAHIGLQIAQSVTVAVNLHTVARGVHHVVVRPVGVDNRQLRRRRSNIRNQHLRRPHTRRQHAYRHIVQIGGSVVVRPQSQPALRKTGKRHIVMRPPLAVGQAGGDRSERAVDRNIGHNPHLKPMAVGGQHIETQLQCLGTILKRRQHKNRGIRHTAADVQALATGSIHRRRTVDIRVGRIVGVLQIPAEHLTGKGHRGGGIGQTVVRLEILAPRQARVGNGHTWRAEGGSAGTRPGSVRTVGEYLHRIPRVGREGVIGNSMVVDHHAVNQHVAGIKHHRVIVHIGRVDNIDRRTVLRDGGHTDSLHLGTGKHRIGIGSIHNICDARESIITACRRADPQPCRPQRTAAVARTVIVAVETRWRQLQTGIGIAVTHRTQKARRTENISESFIIGGYRIQRIYQMDAPVPVHTPHNDSGCVRCRRIVPANAYQRAVRAGTNPELHIVLIDCCLTPRSCPQEQAKTDC